MLLGGIGFPSITTSHGVLPLALVPMKAVWAPPNRSESTDW